MNIPTNTPLLSPPNDYCPPDCDRWYRIPEGLDAGKKVFYSDIQAKLTPAWGLQGQLIAVCMHFGVWDALAKDSMISQWHEALPQIAQNCVLYPETGHWVEETKGAEIAQSILQIMDGL